MAKMCTDGVTGAPELRNTAIEQYLPVPDESDVVLYLWEKHDPLTCVAGPETVLSND